MNFFTLIQVEFCKIRRSRILWILLAATLLLWLPSILNARLNFQMQAEGISPEHNFLIQGFLGMAWFLFPACMVVCTVLLNQIELGGRGILKMLALPISTAKLCLAKFTVLLALAVLQVLMTTAVYYLSAVVASQTQHYCFLLPPSLVFGEAAILLAASLPMLAFFWMTAVLISIPAFSVGVGFAAIVPSILMINTNIWFLYPMAYPFFAITHEYAKLAAHMTPSRIPWIPWLAAAALITLICLLISCLRFGQRERR